MDSDEDYMNDSDEDTNFSEGEEDYIGEQMGGSYELSREKGKLERSDFKYEVLSPEMISHKMFEIIDEVNTVFQVGNREVYLPVVYRMISYSCPPTWSAGC